MSSESYIYLIRDGRRSGPVKIGYANSPARRLEALQCGNPRELTMIHTVGVDSEARAAAIENRLHKACARFRIRGEWFTAEAIEIAREYLSAPDSWPTVERGRNTNGLPLTSEDNQRRVQMILSHPELSKQYETNEAIASLLGLYVGFVAVARTLWESHGRPVPEGCESWAWQTRRSS